MLLKGRGYCPSSFLPRFQLNLISVTIALPARMPLSPVLVICACFVFDCVAVLTVPELTASVESFWSGRGWSGSCFSQLMQLLMFPMQEGRLLLSTPGECKHRFYHVGTTGSVSPVKLFSISLRQPNSEGNSCSCSSPFFFECCLCWFPAVTMQLWGANGVHLEHLSQKEMP